MDTRFSEENKLYIERAFTGYINQPRSLVIYAIKVTGEPEEPAGFLRVGAHPVGDGPGRGARIPMNLSRNPK